MSKHRGNDKNVKTNKPSVGIAVTVAVQFTLLVALTPHALGQQLADALRISRPGLHFNARALAMGNAYSTMGYDFSALYFNPAAMAVSHKNSYTLTMNSNAFRANSDFHGTHVGFTTSNMTISQMGVTMPFVIDSTHHSVLGLGFTQSKDFNLGFKYEGLNAGSRSFIQALAADEDPLARALGLSYPSYDASGKYQGDRTLLGPNMYEKGYLLDEGAFFNLSMGAAVEAAHNVFFGVSASYNTGASLSDLELSAQDTNDVYRAGMLTVPDNPQTAGFIGTDYRLVRELQYSGWNLRFGVLYKLENFIAWSVSYKLPTSHRLRETLFRSGNTEFTSSRDLLVPESETQSFYSFTPPPEATIGAMANFWMLTGTAEATYIDYSAMKLNSGVSVLSDRTRINKRLKEELTAVVNVNAGVEFRPPFTKLSLRAGGMYQPSAFKNAPAGSGQKFLTAGLGINSFDMFQVEIGYAYGWRGEYKDLQTSEDSGAEQSIAYQTFLFTMRFAP
ncbi:MAG: hypothetical protein ACREOO_09445 [bacterium]